MFVAVVGGLATALGVVVEYSLRSRSQRAEVDIRLATLFAEIVPIANGRPPREPSEAVVASLVALGVPPKEALDDAQPGVGAATQAGAIGSLGYLGWRYPALKNPAAAALRSLDHVDVNAGLKEARENAMDKLAADRGWWHHL